MIFTLVRLRKLWKPLARLLSELAPLPLRESASREDFNFPLGFEKAAGTLSRAGRARFISVSW